MTGLEHGVIVAIAPTSRGFGFAVFAASNRMLDWGVKEARRDKNRLAAAKIARMIRDIKPGAVVIENWVHASCRRSARVRGLLLDIAVLAGKNGSTAMVYSRLACPAGIQPSGEVEGCDCGGDRRAAPGVAPLAAA